MTTRQHPLIRIFVVEDHRLTPAGLECLIEAEPDLTEWREP
jgi:hypothetical protein